MTWLSTPLVPLAIAFAIGIALATWTPAALAWGAWAAGLVGAGVLLLARSPWATAALLAGMVGIGALRATPAPLSSDHVGRLALPSASRVEARLTDEPTRWAPDRTRLRLETIRVGNEPRSGLIHATVYGELPPLTEGQRVAAELRLRRAGGFRNPGVFDYGAHLTREGVHVVATGRADRVAALDHPTPPWPVTVRRRALDAIGQALPPASAALLGGLLLGDRTSLPRDIDDGFRRAGVYHVLAVSGFNVALLASSVFALLVIAHAGRRLAAAVAIVIVIAFAFVVGPEPSVLRAVIMGVLVLATVLLHRDAFAMNSLALAALVILAVRPSDLADPGFQLSFAATAGIVLAPLPRGMLLASLGVSIAAQLAVLPITLVHFNQVSTIGVIANLAVVPLAAVATVMGLAAVALSFVTEAGAAVLFDAVWPVLIALRAVVRLAASVPAAIVHLPAPHWTAVTAYAASLALALLAWRRRAGGAPVRPGGAPVRPGGAPVRPGDAPVRPGDAPVRPGDAPVRRETPGQARALGAAALLLLAGALALAAWPVVRPGDGRLRVIVLDVGQGDAIVVETPDRRALLVDAGPGGAMRLDAGERVVAPFLWNRGILRLAATLTTHHDADHAGGMAAVRRLFPHAPDWSAASREPERRWMGGVMISTVVATAPIGAARNDGAVIVRLDFGLASFLLASDITAHAERALLAAGTPLAATVLKVAHHGSRSSSTPAFLRAVQPAIAVISVGPRNPYGHPAAETLDRLAAVGAVVYRTDRDGAVIIETDGRRLTVTRWAARQVDRYCLDPETMC